MDLFINPAGELPIYRQIMRQITSAIAGNHLRPGDKLTSHRDLAERLVIAPLTVKKAYDELERQGLLETLRGKGTFISAKAVVKRSAERERLKEAARTLLHQAYLSGLDLDDALSAVEQAAREIARTKDKD
ncbi:MAG: GntR family transcriptional regulator [Acidobacteria bacterium]|nr:GntR family transcriptional regulator [Acidobacteriota bacterium]